MPHHQEGSFWVCNVSSKEEQFPDYRVGELMAIFGQRRALSEAELSHIVLRSKVFCRYDLNQIYSL